MTATVTNEYLRKEFDNFDKTEEIENLLDELKYSTLIVPMDESQEGCAIITLGEENYIPLFTDIHEYQKVKFKGNFHPEAFDFNFYLELLKTGLHGFVVNVESERFPITKEFLKLMDTDYRFDLDYQPFTHREIRKIYDSINNSELEAFLEKEDNRWDLNCLMEILLKSDLLTLVASKGDYDEFQENGVIATDFMEKVSYCRSSDNCALIFTSPDRITLPNRNDGYYSQLVNFPLFIDHALKSDLAGIIIDEDIVLSRDFLINSMKTFISPCIDCLDDYVIILGD